MTEKLSPDRNGAERSKGGKVFRPLNGAKAEPCRAGLWLRLAPKNKKCKILLFERLKYNHFFRILFK